MGGNSQKLDSSIMVSTVGSELLQYCLCLCVGGEGGRVVIDLKCLKEFRFPKSNLLDPIRPWEKVPR